MRSISQFVIFALLTLGFLCARAQEHYAISGIIKDLEGETLPGATIFLDGSEKATYTNDKGEFKLGGLPAGTYELSVHFVGYKSLKQNVIIQDKSAIVNVTLEQSATTLKEVVITKGTKRGEYMKLFLKNFLGDTENGSSCKILNPQILRFSEQSLFVTARTNDFLEIENKNLGYKIKYLLRDFRINRSTLIASYTGECIFENLKGSETEMAVWNENRKKVYYGSLMHYMRALHRNTVDKEGFCFYAIKNAKKSTQQIDTRKIQTSSIAKHTNNTFLVIRFTGPLYVVYNNPADTAGINRTDEEMITRSLDQKSGSVLELYLKKATVDPKGSLVDYRSFLIKGYWANKRIGDQLPFEYEPDII